MAYAIPNQLRPFMAVSNRRKRKPLADREIGASRHDINAPRRKLHERTHFVTTAVGLRDSKPIASVTNGFKPTQIKTTGTCKLLSRARNSTEFQIMHGLTLFGNLHVPVVLTCVGLKPFGTDAIGLESRRPTAVVTKRLRSWSSRRGALISCREAPISQT